MEWRPEGDERETGLQEGMREGRGEDRGAWDDCLLLLLELCNLSRRLLASLDLGRSTLVSLLVKTLQTQPTLSATTRMHERVRTRTMKRKR